jgi:hypothetical protein
MRWFNSFLLSVSSRRSTGLFAYLEMHSVDPVDLRAMGVQVSCLDSSWGNRKPVLMICLGNQKIFIPKFTLPKLCFIYTCIQTIV